MRLHELRIAINEINSAIYRALNSSLVRSENLVTPNSVPSAAAARVRPLAIW